MTDTEPVTTADVLAKAEHIYGEFTALLERLREALPGNIATLPDTPPVASAPIAATKQPVAERRPLGWELAARAFRRFGFEPHTVRRICSNHPEWAKRLTDGAWYVDVDPFEEFAARVERGEASFAVSEKSALSVANRPSLDENEHIGKVLDHEDDSEQIRETTDKGSRRT